MSDFRICRVDKRRDRDQELGLIDIVTVMRPESENDVDASGGPYIFNVLEDGITSKETGIYG